MYMYVHVHVVHNKLYIHVHYNLLTSTCTCVACMSCNQCLSLMAGFCSSPTALKDVTIFFTVESKPE